MKTEILVLIIYITVVILYVIIGSLTFKYQDGDWEMVNGIPCEKDEECQRIEIVARAMFWPLILTLFIIVTPLILLDKLSENTYNKSNKKN